MIFLDAIDRKNSAKRPPIWLMRQAGRYMHEYQAYRKRYDFMTLCQTPELISEITELPIKAFGFDAAILFSDILLILQALGCTVRFDEGKGPLIQGDSLQPKDVVAELAFVYEAIRSLKKSLKVPLIGFAGAPFTVASYFVEKQSSQTLSKTKKWLLEEPESFMKLINTLTEATVCHLNAQIEAGCAAVQIFDSWAMHLAYNQFEAFVAKPLETILKRLKKCPVILFCRGTAAFYDRLGTLGAQGLSFDWQVDLKTMRKRLPQLCLQGNLDPDILLTNPQIVVREASLLLEKMRADPGFIFNLGHGIHKETPRENVQALVECVKNYA
jgi:uroporphyrinogen decarboxylase